MGSSSRALVARQIWGRGQCAAAAFRIPRRGARVARPKLVLNVRTNYDSGDFEPGALPTPDLEILVMGTFPDHGRRGLNPS